MGDSGWQMLRDALAEARSGRVLLLSSVPALGPRLSWVEAVMSVTPRMEKYEDDLRDQWQSHAHREEWRRFLRLLIRSEEHTSELQSLMRISYAVFCLNKKKPDTAHI